MIGSTGYRHQLDRARRFLERMKASNSSDHESQDMAWAFFQNCWHVKDWIDNDPLVSDATKRAVISMAEGQSKALTICQDLCNGTKHRKLKTARSGSDAAPDHVAYTMHLMPAGTTEDILNENDCIVDDGNGNRISGKKLAEECIEEWERILESQGLTSLRQG